MTAQRAMADARGGDATEVRGVLFRHARMTYERHAKRHQIAAALGRVMPEACFQNDDRAAGLAALDSARGRRVYWSHLRVPLGPVLSKGTRLS